MQNFDEQPRTPIWVWLAVAAIPVIGVAVVWLSHQLTASAFPGLLAALAVILLVGGFFAVRIYQVAVPMKRGQDISQMIQSMGESFKVKIGSEKRHDYHTAKKRFEAAVSAIAASRRESLKLYVADLRKAEARVKAGQYVAATALFEALAALAAEHREPGVDALELNSALVRMRHQRALRRKNSRNRRKQ